MSHQSGQQAVAADQDSLRQLHVNDINFGFYAAVKWRYRVRTNQAKISDCDKATIMVHADALIAAATAWRGENVTLKLRVAELEKAARSRARASA